LFLGFLWFLVAAYPDDGRRGREDEQQRYGFEALVKQVSYTNLSRVESLKCVLRAR
jgi:hypothetical protein